ncbi:LL-diaminopimelate aminotransferase [Pseudobacteroides cellulosolvens]|uniref:Aminotransferase n=1 Tax=Pseudobacteroides cellulosolvens ATCC 35603 = DSM 2933 TaxID=398512 RepID=A0A0L6JKY5_9FIRM|nr:LL-diaminopimelate aminotransferase [Pseudobacteroides cellulosolvens]KNY26425.1 LL-diaminopimelate aminotransferase [Pseudobacteroides cellulosolvens ATCC 35603 = DSM 2933]
MNKIKQSNRLASLPPYIFAKLEQMKNEYKGIDLIDFGVGDPDFPTQDNILNAMKVCLDNPDNHRYPSFKGEAELRKEISRWYQREYGVELDPEHEVLVLLGSKEGIAHLPLALMNDGDYALVPDPGYPAYLSAVIISGGIPYAMPLTRENGYLPVLEDIPKDVLVKSKLMYLNYPNNPTSALADNEFFLKVVEFAQRNNIIVCHDFAYSEITFDGIKPVSFLSVPGSRECGVEFHSFSKTFAMTGWRLGFVTGNREVLASLAKLKSCVDSGVFKAVQYAGIKGLAETTDRLDMMKCEYQNRRDTLSQGLRKMGWEFHAPAATYYFWVRIPERFNMTSLEFSEYLLKEKGLIVTPGIGFGSNGESYIRMAINLPVSKISEAILRLETL